MSDADAQATFAIDLRDGTSGTAETAATALKKLRSSIDADKKALAEMQRAMKDLQGGAVVNIAQFHQLRAQIDAKKNAIAQARSAYISLGGSMSGAANSGKPALSTFEQLADNAKALPGPLGGVLSKLDGLKAMLGGGVIALGLAAIAVGLVALTAASVAATAALLGYGIAQANARRSELLRIEGLTKMRSWFGLAAGNAKEMQASIDSVAGSSALSRDKIAEYSSELYKMGLRGQNAALALDAMAIKGAAQGDAAAHAFAGWAAGAAMAGGSVKKLADDVKARLGGIAAKQMLDLDVQSQKLRESFSVIFSGLDIEGLLKGFSSITRLFSQSTASGRALKAVVTAVFQPMIEAVTFLAPLVKRFFQGVIIGALLVGIAVLKVRNWFRKTFGDSEVLKGFDATEAALKLGVVAVAAFGAAMVATFGLVIGAIALAMPFIWGAVAAVGALALEGLILAAPFLLAAVAIGALIAAGYQLYKLWQEIDWTSLGTAIVDGIVGGLKNGAKWVKDAVGELGTAAWSTFREKLGIQSPSKAFTKLGLAIPEGIKRGVEQGTPDAQAAVGQAVGVPQAPGGAGGRSSGASFTIGDVNIYTSESTASGIMADVKRELQAVLEGVAIQLGATSS